MIVEFTGRKQMNEGMNQRVIESMNHSSTSWLFFTEKKKKKNMFILVSKRLFPLNASQCWTKLHLLIEFYDTKSKPQDLKEN